MAESLDLYIELEECKEELQECQEEIQELQQELEELRLFVKLRI